ncbi:MAG: hypothetical protein AB7K67_01080 [Hyphomicrobiaceae bacterium]
MGSNLAHAATGRIPAGESVAATKKQSRAPDLPLSAVADLVAAWGLGAPLRDAVAEMAEAAPIATGQREAYLQARALKRAWRHLIRAQIEAKCGVLPGIFVGASDSASRSRPLAPSAEDAATALSLTFGLSNALRTILHAARATTRDDAVAQIAEAMAAIKVAIEVREAVAFPLDESCVGAGDSPGASRPPAPLAEPGPSPEQIQGASR